MKKLKWAALIVVAALILFSLWMAGFSYGKGHPLALERQPVHQHQWGPWGEATRLGWLDRSPGKYIQFHSCTNCGLTEFRYIQEQKH